jgi:hypothetical protein
MTNEPFHAASLQSIWQSLPTETITLSVEDMRARASKLDRRIRRRFIVEYVASVVVIIAFSWYATWPAPATPLWPIANVAIIVGTIVMLWNLHRVSRQQKPSGSASIKSLVEYHRANLAYQRDGLRTVWLWYLLPFVPGVVMWLAALWISRPATPAGDVMAGFLIVTAAFCVAVFGLLFALNLLAAAHLQRQIDDLDRFKEKE